MKTESLHCYVVPYVVILFFPPMIASGEDLTDLAGNTYRNAELARVEPDGLILKHDDGLSKVYFMELPSEIGARYGYRQEKAKVFRRQRQLNRRREQAAMKVHTKILQREFPVRVYNIFPILAGRSLYRVHFDVQNNSKKDVLINIRYGDSSKEVYILARENLRDQMISFTEENHVLFVDAGNQTQAYHVEW